MNLKKTLAMLLALCFVFALLPFGAALAADDAEKAGQQLITGTFGNGFEYEFDPVTGILTIRYTGTGSGNLRAFPAGEDAPWAAFRDDIRELNLGEGITKIGANVFAKCTALSSIHFPATMEDINTNAFKGCPKGIEYFTSGDRTKLTAMLENNSVLELLSEEQVEQFEAQLNAAAAAVTEAAISKDVQSVEKEAAATGNTAQTVHMQGPIDTVTTEEGNTVTVTEKVPLYALDHENPPLGNCVRTIVTNPDGSKTVTEIITSIDNDDYRSEAHEEIDPSGRTSLRTEVATTLVGPPDNRFENVVSSKFISQYNADGTGITYQETVFENTGSRMIGAAKLNADGRRESETMYSYRPKTDENGNVVKDNDGNVVEELYQVKRSGNNFETSESNNYYYVPKEGHNPPAPTTMIFNPDDYPFDENDYDRYEDQGPPTGSSGSDSSNSSDGQNNADGNASPNSAPKMMMAKMAAPAAEDANNEESAEQAEDAADPAEDDPADPDAADPADPADDSPAGDAPAAPAGDNPAGDTTPAQPSNDPPAEPAAPAADEPQQPVTDPPSGTPAPVDTTPVTDPPSGGTDQPATNPPADPPVADETPASNEADPPVEENTVPQGE